jgi:hypothetical protein
MSLHIGQQVVCINDVFSPCPYWRRAVRAWPKLGMVYTIRDMREVQGILGLCFFRNRQRPRAFSRGLRRGGVQ